MRHRDRPRGAEHQVRREADEERVEDAQPRRDHPQLVDFSGGEPVQALDPEQEGAGTRVHARTPKQHVHSNDGPKLHPEHDVLEVREFELPVGDVPRALQSFHCTLDVRLL